MYKIVLFLIFNIIFLTKLNAQDWSDWKELYSEKKLKVEVSFKLYSCDTTQIQSKYRYQISGSLYDEPKFLNWKMEYTNCDNEVITQQNSINIGKDGDDGIIESMDNVFVSSSLQKPFYNINTSAKERSSKGVVVIVASKDPISISGKSTIYLGQSTALEVVGGELGTNAEWLWYKEACDSKSIGSGSTINVFPSENTTYFVKAVSNTSETKCAQITVNVNQSSTPALKIIGNENVCKNGFTELSVSGGSLGLDADWYWYENNCDGSFIGKGNSIKVYPKQPTLYYVRAEGKFNKTDCVFFKTRTIDISTTPISIKYSGVNPVCEGEKVLLSVEGGSLADDAKWFWYKGSCDDIYIGEGSSLIIYPDNSTSYFVRAEGKCNITNCASLLINVDKKAIAADGIIYPTKIYKNKRTNLDVDNSNVVPQNTTWNWYKGKCESGYKIGTGSSISIKPKKDEIYLVRAENNCSTSECVQLNVNPIKLHKFHPKYSVNGYEKKVLHIGFGIGLEGGYFSALTNRSIKIGNNTTNSSLIAKIPSAGLKTEFIFHPFIKDYFGIGLISSFSIGTTPYLIKGGKKNSESEKIKYLYSKFDLGIELTAGLKPIKILASYKSSIQSHKFNSISTEGISETILNFNRQIRKDFIIAGFRLGAYKKNKPKRSTCFDITYNLTRDYDWNWSKFNWKYNAISNWQHGIGLGMWVHSILKLQIDASINSRLGSYSTSRYDDLYLGFSLIYNRNAFY